MDILAGFVSWPEEQALSRLHGAGQGRSIFAVFIPHSRNWKVRFNNLQKAPPQFYIKWEWHQCSASERKQKDECIKDYGCYNNPSRRDESIQYPFIHHTLMDISGSFFFHFTSLNRSSSPHKNNVLKAHAPSSGMKNVSLAECQAKQHVT